MNFNQLHLTIIDDDLSYLSVISMALEDRFKVNAFHTPDNAIKFIQVNHTDGIVVDVHMDNMSGFSVCQKVKDINKDLPVFFLTSDTDPKSITEGFDCGGIDYFSKSLSSEELVTRIANRLKQQMVTQRDSQVLKCGDIEMDTHSFLTYIKGKEVSLTPKEFDILRALLQQPNKIFSKPDLLGLLWSDVHVDVNNVDTHMFHLRNKIKGSSTKIETKKGFGYILRP